MASILLISDHESSLELVRAALVTAGHEVLVSRDPHAVHRHVDLALVELDQFKVTAEVRQHASKVVLLSSASEEVTRELVKSSGASGYVRHLGPARLLEDVQSLLDAA